MRFMKREIAMNKRIKAEHERILKEQERIWKVQDTLINDMKKILESDPEQIDDAWLALLDERRIAITRDRLKMEKDQMKLRRSYPAWLKADLAGASAGAGDETTVAEHERSMRQETPDDARGSRPALSKRFGHDTRKPRPGLDP